MTGEDTNRRAASGPVVVAGTAHPVLASSVAAALGEAPAVSRIERFPDGEIDVSVDVALRGHDVYVVQPTVPPVGEHSLELALLADALHRAGAARITAVVPYFGFARQERRTRTGGPLGARVAADLVSCGRFARLVAVDLHSASVEGFFPMPVEHLSAVPLLAEAARAHVRADTVIVSPDLGGAKLAREYGRLLQRPVAIVHKTRVSGREVEVHDVVGDVNAVAALGARGAKHEVTVVATHALLPGAALDVLSHARIARLITTDSVPERTGAAFERTTVSIAPLLADTIRSLAAERPVVWNEAAR